MLWKLFISSFFAEKRDFVNLILSRDVRKACSEAYIKNILWFSLSEGKKLWCRTHKQNNDWVHPSFYYHERLTMQTEGIKTWMTLWMDELVPLPSCFPTLHWNASLCLIGLRSCINTAPLSSSSVWRDTRSIALYSEQWIFYCLPPNHGGRR